MSTSKPLHVLTLTPFYPTERDEAGGCFVAEPLEELAKLGVTNSVLAVQPLYRGKYRARESSVPAEWLRYFSLPGNLGLPLAGAFAFARIVGRVREMLRSTPIDLVHAHGPLPCGHAAMLLSTELHIPYVVSVRGLDAYATEQIPGRAGEWSRRVSRRVYQASRRVICISEKVREEVLKGTSQRTSVVYNGVNEKLFSPGAGGDGGETIVLSVGNLIPIKGHDVLIRAVGAIAGEFPNLKVEIIGDGPEKNRLADLAGQFKIGDRVQFRGRQSRHEVAEAMRRCTIFALPSRYEGLGCVYLEAMSAGKPAIGCRGQGIADIIRHGSNGFLVGPDNEKELSLALAMLLRDESRRHSIAIAARDTILDRLTLAHQAENLVRIYRECVG